MQFADLPGLKACRDLINRIPARTMRIGAIGFCAVFWIAVLYFFAF